MNPARLPIDVRDGAIHPDFLVETDHGWLSSLIEVASSRAGAPWRELEAAMRAPIAEGVPLRRQLLAARVLSRRFRKQVFAARPPPEVRALVFRMAAAGGSREAIVAAAATALGIDVGALEHALFADLPWERVVVPPTALPDASALAVACNLEMCRTLLMRAMEVEIEARGNARALVRRAQRGGLLVTLVSSGGQAVRLRLSGPLRLFRRTTRYGHALGALLPALAGCERFDLVATLVAGERELELRLRTGDPFLTAGASSGPTRSLALAVLLGSDRWEATTDPDPIAHGARLLFPDVELVSRADPACRWLVERVGFWTVRYLAEKQAAYAAAGVGRLVLCVDERLQCDEGSIPPGGRIVLHRGRVAAEDVWAAIET